jgi:radical SAM protein with 4Fe4S-binding SPASM domain
MIDLNDVTTFKIILNKQCNMNCVYCLQGKKYNIVRETPMSPEEFAKFFPEDRKYDIVYFGGEPFLSYDYFIKLTDLIKEKNPNVKFSVVTNGSLITEERVKELNERRIRVTISHDAVAQKITRDKVDILETNGKTISKIERIGFISTLTKHNWNYFKNWEYFENFRKKYNIKQPTVFHMNVRDLLNNIDDDMFIYNNKEYEKMLDEVYEQLKNDILSDNRESYAFRAFWKNFTRIYYECILGNGVTPCYSNKNILNVDTHGNIYACHNSNIINGNIKDLKNVKINRLKIRKECEICSIKDFCPKCPRVVPSKIKYYCYHQIENFNRMIKMFEEIIATGYLERNNDD